MSMKARLPTCDAIAARASDAFEAAAITKLAPEADAEVWQASRLFRRTDELNATVTMKLAEFDAPRGRSYAALGLLAHRQLISYGGDKDRLTPDRLTSY